MPVERCSENARRYRMMNDGKPMFCQNPVDFPVNAEAPKIDFIARPEWNDDALAHCFDLQLALSPFTALPATTSTVDRSPISSLSSAPPNGCACTDSRAPAYRIFCIFVRT
jgi:hypothetical protein